MGPSTTLRILFTLAIIVCQRLSVRAQDESLSLSISDIPTVSASAHRTTTDQAEDLKSFEMHFADGLTEGSVESASSHRPAYPSQVSHQPGIPHKPLVDRPGDINRKDSPPRRYCLADCERAGRPHEIAWWAKCAVNKHYSAWFVGGGNAWVFPKQSRQRRRDEGTWGLDHDGLFHPRRIWLNWSCDRTQGGLGAYETEHQPGIFSQWLDNHHK